MSDSGGEKKDEIPAFKISAKKVDDSWKEEVRKEREAAAAKAAAQQKAALETLETAAGKKTTEPAASVAPAGKASFDEPADKQPGAESTAPAAPAKASPADDKAAAIEQQRTKIFMNFLEGLAQQAMMQLGEMPNPYTGQAELDIQGARYTLELLATIQAKTKGNLNEAENTALTGLLTELRAAFATIAQEMQRQMQAQAANRSGAMRPGPGGTVG